MSGPTPPPQPTLVVVQENRPPDRRPLRGQLVLGRDPESDLPVDDGYLSRRHCMFALGPRGEVLIRDMGSYNGSYVNGTKIKGEARIHPGDVIKVGRTRVFVDFGGEQSESLKIFANRLEPKPGVQQELRTKRPALTEPYREIAGNLDLPPPAPAPGPPAPPAPRDRGPETRPVRPDDKTPIPPPSVEDSAIARNESSGHGRRPRGERGYRVIAQLARLLANVRDPHEFLDLTLSLVLQVIPAERGIVMRLDPARRSLFAECVKSAVPNVDDQTARRLGISHTIARKVIRERVSILVDDATLDQRFREASSVQELQIRSILCVPLWLGEEVSGLIYLDHLLHAYAFTDSDRDLLLAAANLTALGLERLGL